MRAQLDIERRLVVNRCAELVGEMEQSSIPPKPALSTGLSALVRTLPRPDVRASFLWLSRVAW
jgi:hypothetical protein